MAGSPMNHHLSIKSFLLVGAMAVGAISLTQLDNVSFTAGTGTLMPSMSACPQSPSQVVGAVPSEFCDTDNLGTAYISHGKRYTAIN